MTRCMTKQTSSEIPSNKTISPSKCELIIINDVPNRLKVIANEAFVRTGPTARYLIISSSGSARHESERRKIFVASYQYKTILNLVV